MSACQSHLHSHEGQQNNKYMNWIWRKTKEHGEWGDIYTKIANISSAFFQFQSLGPSQFPLSLSTSSSSCLPQ